MEKLAPKEEEIMQVFWEIGKAFVKDVKAALPDDPHYNTVSTIIRRLETKGFIAHEDFGSTYRYFPLISKEEYRSFFMKSAAKRFFSSSYKNMISAFVQEEKISPEELREILDFIESKDQKNI